MVFKTVFLFQHVRIDQNRTLGCSLEFGLKLGSERTTFFNCLRLSSMPILLNCLEIGPLQESHLRSLDFVIDRIL